MSTRSFAIGDGIVLFLLFIGQAVIRGGKAEDPVAAAAQKREFERANEEYEQKKAMLETQKKVLSDVRASLARQEEQIRENHALELRRLTDDKQRAELRERQEADKAEAERKRIALEEEH